MLTKLAVLEIVSAERDYQDAKWGALATRPREVGSWITLLAKFVHGAQVAYCESPGNQPALAEIRKVAALAFACLEQHGAPSRGRKEPSGTPAPATAEKAMASGRVTTEDCAVGTCPRCGGVLRALLFADGSGWEADVCESCDAQWYHNPPKRLNQLPGEAT